MFTADSITPPVSLLSVQVSVFPDAYRTTAVEQLPLSTMLARIQDGTYKEPIEALRTLRVQDAAQYKEQKTLLPAFTPGCALTTRARKVAWKDKLIAPTQIIHLDVDDIDAPALKARVVLEPSVVFAFISPSGEGLKLGIASAGITDTTTYSACWRTTIEAWKALFPDAVFKEDEHVKFLHALCFVSYDPDLFVNASAVPFLPPPPSSSFVAPPSSSSSFFSEKGGRKEGRSLEGGRREGGEEQARVDNALRHIPAEEYDTWLRVGMALHASGEAWARSLWDTWSASCTEKYNAADQEATWSSFKLDGGVNLATVFHLAQQYGYAPGRQATRRGDPAVPDMTRPAPVTQDALPYSDYTNALAFVRDHGTNVRYCFPWGKWLAWTGTHWQIDDAGRVMRWAKETVKRLARHAEDLDDISAIAALLRHVKASLSTSKLKALVENAQSELPLPVLPEDLDRDPWLLNATNGTIDLHTGTLKPHSREDLLTHCIPVAFDPNAVCPTWDSFLARIMAGNANLISFLQRAVGYALTGVIREHVLLILWGSGRNGKSTFLNTLLTLLGAYAMKAPSELLLVSNNDRHPTERAELFHKRCVAVIETEQGRRMAEVFVKEATGGDPITARRMREDFWTFLPTHKLFLATNHKPVITGTDNAIWERMRLIPFTVTIDKPDTTLPEKLQGVLPGILAWAVRGCIAWQRYGLGEPEEVTTATAGYRAEMDVLGAFIEECCLTGSNYRVKASELYEAYKHWCDQQGETAKVQRNWGMALTERGYEHGKVQGRSWWKGIAIGQTEQVDEVDEGRPKVGIKHKRNESREHYAGNWSTSSTSSTGTDSTEFDEGIV